jgi:hypothetical protein
MVTKIDRPHQEYIPKFGTDNYYKFISGILHEGYHWAQHHGTSIGALLSLIQFSQARTLSRNIQTMGPRDRNILSDHVLGKTRYFTLDSSGDLPTMPGEGEDDITILFRMWHDHLLVYNIFFNSELQDSVPWPRSRTLSEVLADCLIALDDLGLYKYPGNNIARSYYSVPEEPTFVVFDGFRLTTKWIFEAGALANEALSSLDLATIGIARSVDEKDLYRRLFHGNYSKAVNIFLKLSGLDVDEPRKWLQALSLTCDLSLNPALPPFSIEPAWATEWQDIYPPWRFLRISHELGTLPALENKNGEISFSDIVDTLCRKCGYVNPSTFQYPHYVSSANSINFDTVDDSVFAEAYERGKGSFWMHYRCWVQRKMLERRALSPDFFISFGQWMHARNFGLEVLGISGGKWASPQFFWTTDGRLAYPTPDSGRSSSFQSHVIFDQVASNALSEYLISPGPLELSDWPEEIRSLSCSRLTNDLRASLGS